MSIYKIDERGSLNLIMDDTQFTVQLRDVPHKCAELRKARENHSIADVTLNGSQVQTVKAWFKEYLGETK